jgi:hypothetical protein
MCEVINLDLSWKKFLAERREGGVYLGGDSEKTKNS